MAQRHETDIEMDLTATERELARTLASLSPTITPGVASVPTRELALRAGVVRSKQRLRTWQLGSVLVLAGLAAAYVNQPGQRLAQPLASNTGGVQIEVPFTVDSSPDIKALSDAVDRLRGYPGARGPRPSGPLKMVLWSAGANGEIMLEIVPQDWELCDH